jgi:hypothetical protein
MVDAADRVVDAAIPVDAKNAPTGIWKTAQNAVSHSPHPSFLSMKKSDERLASGRSLRD